MFASGAVANRPIAPISKKPIWWRTTQTSSRPPYARWSDVPFSHGTLSIDSSRPQAFSGSDIAVLQEMAVDLSEVFHRLEDLQQLAEERQRLAVTLRSIGDCVIAIDAEGRIVLLNRVVETLTGWTQDEWRGRECAEVFTFEQTSPHEDPVATSWRPAQS